MSDRPRVSVIVPFGGGEHDARELFEALGRIQLREGDELIVADNTASGIEPASGISVVRAPDQRSSYYARNIGAEAARNDWLLFIDADCIPDPGILDAYFAAEPGERVGALAGDVLDDAAQTALIARYTRSRELLDADRGAAFEYKPQAVTANLMVRRAAWASVGGFLEAIRSGGDTDFSWRIQNAGWELVRAPGASVEHHHRETLRGYLKQKVRYGASRSWLSHRYPGSYPPIRAWINVPRAFVAALRWLISGQRERAAFRALDGIGGIAEAYGFTRSNAADARAAGADARGVDADARSAETDARSAETDARSAETDARIAATDAARGMRRIAVLTDAFPAISETFISQEALALERLGWRVRIEATSRPPRSDRAAGRALDAAFIEDDPLPRRLADAAWLVARHPLRAFRDELDRFRWRREEHAPPLRVIAPVARRVRDADHLHAHFAAGAALTTLRISRLLGIPYSVTAHAYDIYREPRNLVEKLESAAFATSGCDYTVNDLRRIAPNARVHKIIMGVDTERLRRTRPYRGDRTIVAVGRLVEKKGFADLIEAAAELDDARVVIAGDGPLRADLERRIHNHNVELVGALQQSAVLELVEDADVLCMPCVVAADGDRDSMPVVVKEALALEVPVVATDEVGLPEMVRPEWGALVPPHDPKALATALRELLNRPPDERLAMGKAGRAFVAEHCNVDTEAAKLADLIESL